MKPYYRDSSVTLYLGDSREVLSDLGDVGVDLILTDPPYNRGMAYDRHDDAMSRGTYELWCAEWFGLARLLTKRAVVFPGHGNVDIWYSDVVACRPTAMGCWYKPGNHASSLIGYEEWEPWLYWHGGDKGLLGGSSVVKATVGEQPDTGNHPCPKPLSLMTKLLLKCRSKHCIDPFAGSGTTLVAAKLLGLSAIGIEVSERYCEIAANRLRQEVLPLQVTA